MQSSTLGQLEHKRRRTKLDTRTNFELVIIIHSYTNDVGTRIVKISIIYTPKLISEKPLKFVVAINSNLKVY